MGAGRAGTHLGRGVAQRAAEEGEQDVEDAAPGVQLVAVLVAQALPQEPEQPLPLGAVLRPETNARPSEPRLHLQFTWGTGQPAPRS